MFKAYDTQNDIDCTNDAVQHSELQYETPIVIPYHPIMNVLLVG